jgi:LysR family hydrogen peroxide-inducible transcriptional activator
MILAQEKHFGRAADRSFISQPTLSSAIKKLEHQLNVQLFERGHRQEVKLTEQGQNLIPLAQQVLDKAEAFQSLSQSQADLFQQPFKLGVIYSVAPYLLPSLIPKLKKTAPDMPLLIEENYTHVLKQQLLQGNIDAAIIALPFNEAGIETTPLYKEAFCVVSPKHHPLTKSKRIKRSDIHANELLLLSPGHCFRDQVLEACPHCVSNKQSDEMFRGGSLETIVQMVASGAGVSILPKRCAEQHKHNPMLSIIRLEKPEPYREIALAWRKSSPKKKIIKLLANTQLK